METTNSELISRLLDGGIDLIFASVNEDHPLIASKKIFEEEMCLLIPESLLSAKDRKRIKYGDYAPLAACPFLMMNRQEDISGVIGNAFFDRHGIVPKIAAGAFAKVAGSYKVFDLMGSELGNIRLNAGATLTDLKAGLKTAGFGSGVYVVRNPAGKTLKLQVGE